MSAGTLGLENVRNVLDYT